MTTTIKSTVTKEKLDLSNCTFTTAFSPEDGVAFWDVVDPSGEAVDSWDNEEEAKADAKDRTETAITDEQDRINEEYETAVEEEKEEQRQELIGDITGELDGLDIEMLRKIAKKLGLSI